MYHHQSSDSVAKNASILQFLESVSLSGSAASLEIPSTDTGAESKSSSSVSKTAVMPGLGANPAPVKNDFASAFGINTFGTNKGWVKKFLAGQKFPAFPDPIEPLLAQLNLTPAGLSGEQFQTEISAYASFGGRLFILSSGGGPTLQVVNATDPSAPVLVARQELGAYTTQSVAIYGNLVAVALSPDEYDVNPAKGLVRFYRIGLDGSLTFVQDVTAGYLPDSIAFNDDGSKLVVANEGQPNIGSRRADGSIDYTKAYTVDPVGSIGIIDIKGKVNLKFTYTDLSFEGIPLPEGIRLSGPSGTTAAQDLEPEYVSIVGNTAYVTLQENNGVARVNLATRRIEAVLSLGTVNFSQQLVDLSDRDGSGNAAIFKPLFGQQLDGQDILGLRMPDGIAAFKTGGRSYFLTANEGDGRVYADLSGVTPVYDDELRRNRLKTLRDDSTAPYTAFGARSVSLFDANGTLIWDSGTTLQTLAVAAGVYDDTRSDDKGVEPETVVTAEIYGRTFAIVGLERTTKAMVVVFDVTDPTNVIFVTSKVLEGSRSVEGLMVIPAEKSPTGSSLLVVSNEVSNTLDLLDLTALIAAPAAASAGSFAPTMLKDVAGGPELTFTSLLTNGEFTTGFDASSVYTPVGIFDGMGAFANGNGTYTLLVNHELGATGGYGYRLDGVAGTFTGARISSFLVDIDFDNDPSNGYQSRILQGGLAYDRIFLDGSDVAISAVAELGAAGFKRFCSANLIEAGSFGGRGFVDRVYLVGEEEFTGVGGAFFALDVASRALHEVEGFGRGTWESATLIDTGNPNTVAVLLFDDAEAPLYLWVGTKSTAPGASFLERNGLATSQGSLYTFVPELADTGLAGLNSEDLLGVDLNTPVAGRWVDLKALNPSYTELSAGALRQLAAANGAILLSRIEDGDVNPANGQQAVFVATGTRGFNNGDLYGNVYTIDFTKAFNPSGLLAAGNTTPLRVIYDADRLADPTSGLRNPDNLAWGTDGFVYLQEDRANGGGTNVALGNFGLAEASIWKLDPTRFDPVTGQAVSERWAQIDRTVIPTSADPRIAYGQSQPAFTNADSNGIGNWESSGIIDVSAIYGGAPGSFFLANIQAHSISGGNLWGSNYLVEGGQILLIEQQLA